MFMLGSEAALCNDIFYTMTENEAFYTTFFEALLPAAQTQNQ